MVAQTDEKKDRGTKNMDFAGCPRALISSAASLLNLSVNLV
jgi:hypothetical protein